MDSFTHTFITLIYVAPYQGAMIVMTPEHFNLIREGLSLDT